MDENILKSLFSGNDENCPLPGMIMGFLSVPRPFGFTWSVEKIKKFLSARGYCLIDRFDEDIDDMITVACKKDDEIIPEKGNLVEVFKSEIEDIIFEWLLREGAKKSGQD